MSHRVSVGLVLGLAFTTGAEAQLPLTIEELLVANHSLKLQTGLHHSNSEFPLLALAPLREGQYGPSLQQRQSRVTTLSSRLRYGLRRDLEVNAAVLQSRVAWRELQGRGSGDQYALTLGANWLLSPENRSPAVLLTAGIDALATSWLEPDQRHYGKSIRLGAHLYRSLDPVVLSLALQQEWRAGRELWEQRLSPGDVLWLQPQVNFAVNHRVTLSTGLTLQLQGADRLAGSVLVPSRQQTGIVLGAGLQAGPRSTLFLDTQASTSGGDGATIALEWIYRF